MEEKEERLLRTAEQVDVNVASNIVVDCMRTYAQYTVSTKFANPIDGLKTVQRRALWAIRNIDRDTKQGMLIAKVMEYHPYGDSSIKDALDNLSQPFANIVPLVHCDTNYGSYYGNRPAQMRYMEARRADFAMDVYFNGINLDRLDYIRSETGEGFEPKFLVPKIPMALLTAPFGLAVGFKSSSLPLSFSGVCNMAKAFVRSKTSLTSYSSVFANNPQWFYPDSYVPNLLVNTGQIDELVKQGIYLCPGVYDGVLELYPSMIVITTLPIGGVYDGLEQRLLSILFDKKTTILSDIVQQIRSSSSKLYHLEILLKRGVNVFDALETIKQLVRFRSMPKPSANWVDSESRMKSLNLQDILELWYDARRRSIIADFKDKQNKLLDKWRQIDAKCMVIDRVERVVEITNHAPDPETAYEQLSKEFNIMLKQAEYLASLKLSQLTNKSRSELLVEREQVVAEIKGLKSLFTSVDKLIIEAIEKIEDKYDRPRMARIPSFKGYVQIGTGMIQYWDDTERYRLMLDFKPENVCAFEYPHGTIYKYLITSGGIETESNLSFPKEFIGNALVVSKRKLHSTICLNKVEKTMFRMNVLSDKCIPELEYCPVGDKFTAIDRFGLVYQQNTSSIVLRKNHSPNSGASTEFIYVSHVIDEEVVVVHCNTKESNIVKMDIVVPGDKIRKSPVGSTIILGVYLLTDPITITVPDKVLSRIDIRHLDIESAKSLMGDKRNIRLLLNKNGTDHGGKFIKGKHGVKHVVGP